MPLHTDNRPKTLEDIVGNEAMVASLESVLTRDVDVPHSYFLTGLPGGGKTTIARIIRIMLDIQDGDYYEYNAANTRGIDTIRTIGRSCEMRPMFGTRKMFMLDECHQVTGAAMEAMLKLLEEPPNHVYFAMCTSEPEKIKGNTLKAVRRRCHEVDLKALTRGQIKKLLESVLEKEGVVDFPVDITRKIIGSCWGSAGQALSMLDSVLDMESVEMAEEAIENLVVSEESVTNLIKILIDKKLSGPNKWEQIRKIVDKMDQDPEKIRHAILTYMGKVMLGKGIDVQLARQMSMFMDTFMYTGKAGLILALQFACQASD